MRELIYIQIITMILPPSPLLDLYTHKQKTFRVVVFDESLETGRSYTSEHQI